MKRLALTLVDAADPSAVSPKVSRPTWALLIAAALVGLLEAVDPSMLAFLGDYAGLASLLIGAVLQFLTGYLTADPARGEPELPNTDETNVVG